MPFSDAKTSAQKWILHRGSGSVQLAGTNYCLDAGSSESPTFLAHSTPPPTPTHATPQAPLAASR